MPQKTLRGNAAEFLARPSVKPGEQIWPYLAGISCKLNRLADWHRDYVSFIDRPASDR